jgi:putative long chain acyl-CoA synthase
VVAVTLREGVTLTASELDRAFGAMSADQRPDYVRVVDDIPVTTWGRPVWTALRKAGLPDPGLRRGVWRLDDAREHYREV